MVSLLFSGIRKKRNKLTFDAISSKWTTMRVYTHISLLKNVSFAGSKLCSTHCRKMCAHEGRTQSKRIKIKDQASERDKRSEKEAKKAKNKYNNNKEKQKSPTKLLFTENLLLYVIIMWAFFFLLLLCLQLVIFFCFMCTLYVHVSEYLFFGYCWYCKVMFVCGCSRNKKIFFLFLHTIFFLQNFCFYSCEWQPETKE